MEIQDKDQAVEILEPEFSETIKIAEKETELFDRLFLPSLLSASWLPRQGSKVEKHERAYGSLSIIVCSSISELLSEMNLSINGVQIKRIQKQLIQLSRSRIEIVFKWRDYRTGKDQEVFYDGSIFKKLSVNVEPSKQGFEEPLGSLQQRALQLLELSFT